MLSFQSILNKKYLQSFLLTASNPPQSSGSSADPSGTWLQVTKTLAFKVSLDGILRDRVEA